MSVPSLAALSPEEKRALLARLLREKAAAPQRYPASFAQQRMYLLWRLDPDSPAYTIFTAVRAQDDVDPALMERALQAVAQRHAALRTTFDAADGQLVQVVAPQASLALPLLDLSDAPADVRERVLARALGEHARRPFDLHAGPLFRAALLRLGQREHVLTLSMHHSVADGWSINILTAELLTLYGALAGGAADPLPALPIQYADFAVWQREQLAGEAGQAELAYWKERLAGAPELLELPADRPRPPQRSLRGAHLALDLPAPTRAALDALCRRERLTPFTALLAAFAVLLQRHAGRDDFLLGTPTAGRGRFETEGLIGLFVNTLVLRCDLSGDPSFHELLGRLRETMAGAQAHQSLPFEWLVDALGAARSDSHTPLVQVLFVFQSQQSLATADDGTQWEVLEVENDTAKFDLTAHVEERGDGLRVSFEYSSDLFDAATIRALLAQYARLLEAALTRPARRISQLPLLSPQEARGLVAAHTPQRFDCGPLHRIAEAQAAARPDAVALVWEGGQLSYAALERRANRLAHQLRALGVGPETCVGLCLGRSAEAVVAMLATLKAGGAYVPLDPAYPAERLRLTLEDARPAVLVTASGGAPWADGALDGCRVLDLAADAAAIAAQPDTPPAVAVTAENLAYVIYTSGSTGRPKGVMVTHGCASRLFTATARWFDFGADDVWTLFHSTAFDFSVWEIWGALLYGGRLVVVPYLVSRAPDQFAALLLRERVTVLNQTPSAFRPLIQAVAEAGADVALRYVIFGGEALSFASLRPWVARHGDARPQLINMYGITETTVHVTYRPVRGDELDSVPGSLIGAPIPDLGLYVLDRHMQPVPAGVVGELYVGGAGVARGYLGRPDLTAERFVPDPFRATVRDHRRDAEDAERPDGDESALAEPPPPGGRLYRTGDLARQRAGGELEYLGRADQQVKIRGFRIELGEIEAALLRHPSVREAAVLVRDEQGQPRLVAYVVADPARPAAPHELRAHLRAALPEHMVPAHVVALDALPLTGNGKLDRAALPAPEPARPDLPQAFVAPADEAEARLAAIWREVLGLSQVGVHDNFFEVGGDSILSLQIVARANQAGIHLNPRHIFAHPTIAGLAQAAASASAPQAEQGAVTGPVPLTPIQHWLFEQPLAAHSHYNQGVLLELRQPIDAAVLAAAATELLAHHDALRLRFTRAGAAWEQTSAPPGEPAALTVVDLAGLSAAEQNDAVVRAVVQMQGALDLADGPLLRMALLRCGARGPDRLAIVVHHLAIDHVSWQFLLEDLHALIQQIAGGAPPELPAKTDSFKRWAERLADYAGGDEPLRERELWLGHARARVGRCPIDMPGGAAHNSEDSADTVERLLDAAATQALLAEAPKAYATRVDELLLAALAQSLAAWTGAPAALIALESHGRGGLFEDEVDRSRTVGWFTSIYPLLIELAATAGPADAIVRAKESRRRIPNQGIGYGVLRYLSPDAALRRQLAEQPQPEVLFNYLGQASYAWAEDALWGPPANAPGPMHDPAAPRPFLLELSGHIGAGQLHLRWTYSRNLHRTATIERLADDHLARLRALIAHCQDPRAGGFTPSDFPLARLDDRKLQKITSLLSKAGQGKRSR